jgi:hypothetical protein
MVASTDGRPGNKGVLLQVRKRFAVEWLELYRGVFEKFGAPAGSGIHPQRAYAQNWRPDREH